MQQKLDLAKQYKHYYSATSSPVLTTIEAAQYLSVTGQGNPSSGSFSLSVEALYAVAYAIKFMCKAHDQDFVVSKLEGQWWYDTEKYGNVDMADAPAAIPRSEWQYRLLIRLPAFVNAAHIAIAVTSVVEKKNIARAADITLYLKPEQKVVQMMHNGPFDKEPGTLMIMKRFIDDNGWQQDGLHHEIYLSDFRRTKPEKLRTILREPVR